MKGIYYEEKGIELLGKLGVTKSEFARRMGIQRQNVNALFRTNNLEIIARAAEVLEVPLGLLVGYVDESKTCDEVFVKDTILINSGEILPENVSIGNSVDDIELGVRL